MNDFNDIAKSRELIFLFDAKDCNPNGERDTHASGPRIDGETGRAIVTDLRIKRFVRDYFLKTSDSNNEKILVKRDFIYKQNEVKHFKDVFIDDLPFDEEKIKDLNEKQIYDSLAETFIDHRLFGHLFEVSNNLYGITGPVQFETTFSLNKPSIIPITITSELSSESTKGAGAMGQYHILNYAIFPVRGIVKYSLARISKATESDIRRLYDGLWDGLKTLNTRSKIGQTPRLLLSFVMKKPGYQIPRIRSIFDDYRVNEKLEDIQDVSFDLERFKILIGNFGNKIEYIEYREDPVLKFVIGKTEIHSITEISNLIKNVPPFIEV